MKVEITEIAPCRHKIEVSVPVDKVNEAYDNIYKELGNRVQIKGFRKGHVPRKIMEKKFGEDVVKDATSKIFQDTFLEALQEKDLSPLGDPDIKVEDLKALPNEEFSYSTEIDVRPKFDLPEYKGIELTEEVEKVADDQIDAHIERIRQAFAEYNQVDDGAKEGDFLLVDVVVKAGDEEMVNEQDQRLKVEGKHLFGLECEDLVKKLKGTKKDSKKKLTIDIPETYFKKELRGQKAEVVMQVKAVERPDLPEVNQQLAQQVGCDDVEKLKERIRENLAGERKQQARQQLERAAIDKLVEICNFELPEEFLKRLTQSQLMQNKMRLARMGATAEYLEENSDEMEKVNAEETERTLRWNIISDTIADKEEIEVTEAEMQNHIQMLAQSYQTTPAKMMKRIGDLNGFAGMISEIRDVKVTQFLIENAKVTTKEIEPKEEEK